MQYSLKPGSSITNNSSKRRCVSRFQEARLLLLLPVEEPSGWSSLAGKYNLKLALERNDQEMAP